MRSLSNASEAWCIRLLGGRVASRRTCPPDGLAYKQRLNIILAVFLYMTQTHKFSAILHREGDWYVSWCPEMDIASQGKTMEEAVANLKEAVELYMEDEDFPVPQGTSFLTTFEVTHGKTSHLVSA